MAGRRVAGSSSATRTGVPARREVPRHGYRVFVHGISRQPAPDISVERDDCVADRQREGVAAIDGRDTGVEPPHVHRGHRSACHLRRVLELFEHEAIANLLLERVECGLPVRGNPTGLDVDRGRVPAERLVEDRLQREVPLVPLLGDPTGFERNRSGLPDVLKPASRQLLRIEVLHVRKAAARCAHVTPAVEPPATAQLHTVLQRRQRIEIHQQQSARERLEVEVDQLLLNGPVRQVRTPALSPVAHGGNVHMIEVGVTVVALSRFEDERAPIPDIERIVRIRRPNRAVLVRGGVGSLRARRDVPVGHRMLVVVRHDPDGQPSAP